MAPASSILAATSAASSKRPAADSEPEQLLADSSSSALPQQVSDDASRSKSQQQQQLECPRCRSTNTKFCYYNNYSTSQPRHFCRPCRRYWTHGGTLRDVPVGGATRRANNKRRKVSDDPSSSSGSPPHTATTTQQDLSSTASCFPFLSDGSFYLPQLDLGFFPPAAGFSAPWPSCSSAVPDFYDGLAPWDDGMLAGGAWPGDDIAGLEFSWPPPGN